MAFGRISRAALSREPFLDERMSQSVAERAQASLPDIATALRDRPPGPAPGLIFHSSFCCSTLMARALDAPGSVLALKEPGVLMDVANALRVEAKLKRDPQAARSLVRTAIGLLARPVRAEKKVVIKLTNAANNLLDFVEEPALLMYGGLKDYLVSIIKKGEEGRHFVRQQFNIFSLDPGGLAQIPHRQAMGFTDLQVAALVWRFQIEQFATSIARSTGSTATLDGRTLLAKPAETLKSAARHLRLPISDDALEAAAQGDIFSRDAKDSRAAYSAARREADEKIIADRWRSELELVLNWADTLNLGVDARLPLGRNLAT